MLRMYIKCISTKSFDEIFNVYKKHQMKEEAN